MWPDHTKLWSSKGKHLALHLPVPSPPVQGMTQLLQHCITSSMGHLGKRDKEAGTPGYIGLCCGGGASVGQNRASSSPVSIFSSTLGEQQLILSCFSL